MADGGVSLRSSLRNRGRHQDQEVVTRDTHQPKTPTVRGGRGRGRGRPRGRGRGTGRGSSGGRVRGSGRGRGRGRGRGKEGRIGDVTEETLEDQEEKERKFVCSSCGSCFRDHEEAESHVLRRHYCLARINDDEDRPFTDNETITAYKKALKVLKTLVCPNDECDKSFRSGLGLKSHLQLCGKSDQEVCVNCESCGKRLKPGSLKSHMKTHKEKAASTSDYAEESGMEGAKPGPEEKGRADSVTGSRTRTRRAALKANKFIKLAASGNTNNDEGGDDTDYTKDSESQSSSGDECESVHHSAPFSLNDEAKNGEEIAVDEEASHSKESASKKKALSNRLERNRQEVLELWKNFIIRPQSNLIRLKNGLLGSWKKLVTQGQILSCPNEKCSNQFTTHQGLLYHYKRCGVDLCWSCGLCNFVSPKVKKGLLHHLVTFHKDQLPKVPDHLTDAIVFSEFTRPTSSAVSKHFVKKQKITSIKANVKDRVSSTLKRRKTLDKKKVFTDWLPCKENWVPLKEREYSVYMPQLKQSASFKLNDSEIWETLNVFESKTSRDHVTMFTGGPIWATAWCPIPLNESNQNQYQNQFCFPTNYLALATCISADVVHLLNDVDTEVGLIQLWDCKRLSLTCSKDTKVQFSLGIAHDYGVIWDMEWCPNGSSWESPKISCLENHRLPRLGLLCLACGDGEVRILSIPHPDLIETSHEGHLICRPDPVVILDPPGVGPSVAGEASICKCLSWLKTDEYRLIAAGYGNGVIAVWDLKPISPLLVIERSSSQLILLPKLSWSAHGAAVNCLQWAPYSGAQIVASGSYDRCTKVWDIDDLAAPMNVLKKGVNTDIDWSVNWCGLFTAYDECNLNFQANTHFKDLGFFDGQSNALSSHKSCVWGVSVSEWLNSEASVDASGEATIYTFLKWRIDARRAKRNLFEKIPLYRMQLKALDEDIASQPEDCSDRLPTTDNSSKEQPLLYTYAEVTSRFGVHFLDTPLHDLEKVDPEVIARVQTNENMQYQRPSDYPLLALTRVEWNPNKDSFTWVSTAGQAGFCRISCLSSIIPS